MGAVGLFSSFGLEGSISVKLLPFLVVNKKYFILSGVTWSFLISFASIAMCLWMLKRSSFKRSSISDFTSGMIVVMLTESDCLYFLTYLKNKQLKARITARKLVPAFSSKFLTRMLISI